MSVYVLLDSKSKWWLAQVHKGWTHMKSPQVRRVGATHICIPSKTAYIYICIYIDMYTYTLVRGLKIQDYKYWKLMMQCHERTRKKKQRKNRKFSASLPTRLSPPFISLHSSSIFHPVSPLWRLWCTRRVPKEKIKEESKAPSFGTVRVRESLHREETEWKIDELWRNMNVGDDSEGKNWIFFFFCFFFFFFSK